MSLTKYWLVVGEPKNWISTFSQPVPIWGLRPSQKKEFEQMNVGDILYFYSTSPISGIIGFGRVKDKYIDEKNLVWEDELKRKEVIWPLRFRIQVLKVLPKDNWKTNAIKIDDLGIFLRRGFQQLTEEDSAEISKRVKEVLKVDEKNIFSGPTLILPKETQRVRIVREMPQKTYKLEVEKLDLSHKKLQEMLAEIGKLQSYYTQIEYPINLQSEKMNLDVVWLREIDGVPTIAFEIELSGEIEKALARLNFAFKKWNSRPRLVIREELIKRFRNAASLFEMDFSKEIVFYTPNEIQELYSKKIEWKRKEEELKLF
ncbi:MAG: EVE domain-containing protein [Candidatus Aenigmatarchaeota archaeon]